MSVDDETLRVYGRQAEEYARAYAGDMVADAHLPRFIASLPKGARVLDLGCGPGLAAARMAEAGLEVDATDATPEMVDMCAAAHPGVTAWIATFDEIAGAHLYDGVWANFSLLHAQRSKLPDYLAALRTALKPGGKFHIGMKTGSGAKRDALGRLYTYYSHTELEGYLRAAGFTPTGHWFGEGVGLDGTNAPNVVIAADG